MKKIILITGLLIISLLSYGQVQKVTDEFPEYQGVVAVDGLNKKRIYSSLKLWVADAFKSAQDVLQLDDQENGTILCKGNFLLPYFAPTHIHFTLKLDVKDNRFRSTFTITDAKGNNGMSNWGYIQRHPNFGSVKSMKEDVGKKVWGYIEDMRSAVKENTSKSNNDW